MDGVKETGRTYGFLWSQTADDIPSDGYHYDAMQAVIGEPIVRGNIGIEVGSGCGYDIYNMAKGNPSVRFVTIDISDGILVTKKRVSGLRNVLAVKASALAIPARDDSFDFAYSFGVLHHTSDPRKGLSEIFRVLKKGSPAFLYLYENHAGNPLKYIPLKVISCLRLLTTRIPKRILYILAWITSPFTYIIFTVPAKILARFKATEKIAAHMPFNFGTGLFSLRGDLYDRFGAPIEHRFSKEGLYSVLARCGYTGINITKLKNTAGWVAWGYKA